MGIGIDGHQAPDLEPRLVPAPIQIEPPWVRIAVLGAGSQNLLDIDLIARPPQRLPPRHVRMVVSGVGYGRCGLLALNAGDDKVEAGEDLVRIVERAVGQDILRPGFSKLTRKTADPWRSLAATDQSARRLWPGARARPRGKTRTPYQSAHKRTFQSKSIKTFSSINTGPAASGELRYSDEFHIGR
jgi:hypothetical protein